MVDNLGLSNKKLFRLPRILARYATYLDIDFYNGGEKVAPGRIFSGDFLLPIIVLDAAKIWSELSISAISLQGIEGMSEPFYSVFSEIKDRGQATDQYSLSRAAESFGANWDIDNDSLFGVGVELNYLGSDVSSTIRCLTFNLAARRTLGLKRGMKIDLNEVLAAWDRIDWQKLVLEINSSDSDRDVIEIMSRQEIPLYLGHDYDPNTEYMSVQERLNFAKAYQKELEHMPIKQTQSIKNQSIKEG